MASISARLKKIKGDPSFLIDPHVVERACREVGYTWRERTLDPLCTLQLFALQIAHGNTAISHVVRLAGERFSESAYCQARARLPLSVMHAVLESFAAGDGAPSDRSAGLWCGHRVALMDGTGVSIPDESDLRAAFGAPSSCGDGCGLPLIKTLAVFRASDGFLLGLHAAPASSGDLKYAHDLHAALLPGDVLVGDRGFCSYIHLAELRQIGCHGVFRVSSSRAMPFPARSGERRPLGYNRHRRHEPILVKLISLDDQVVEIVKPHNRPKYMTPEAFTKIPGKQVVRAVRYRVTGDGVRPREITLLTTLTDAGKYSAKDLGDLYLMRWRVEVNIRHLKRTLGMDRLKCRSVEGVARELMMFALIYNAVCVVRARTARELKTDPMCLSFIDTLRGILVVGPAALANLAPLVKIKRWPTRPPRVQPRQLKRKHSGFRVMIRSREQLIRRTKRSPVDAN